MKDNYAPTNTNQKLAHLIEECGEVLAAAGKSQRFGFESYNPEVPEDERELNIDWLLREMTDLQIAMLSLQRDLLKMKAEDTVDGP